jgi:TRAP-type C4-dicarboxylate transport system permease small subunit
MNEWMGSWIRVLVYVFTGLVCFEVLLRYGFNKPTIQLPVIVTMTAAAMYALSLGNIMRNDGHVRIDISPACIPREEKRPLRSLVDCCYSFRSSAR